MFVYILHLLMLTTAVSNTTDDDILNNSITVYNSKNTMDDIPNKPIYRKPSIKLNTKQSLLMNQIVNSYIIRNAKNKLCANHSKEYGYALRSFEPWALKMFDSSSKLQAGVLAGNVMDFGSFKQCIQISQTTLSGEINGQHCTIQIKPPTKLIKTILKFKDVSEKRYPKVKGSVEGTSIYWSVCLPDSCPISDIRLHFSKLIQIIGEGLDLVVSLEDVDCYSKKDEPTFTTVQYISISIIGAILFISIVSTLLDVCSRRNNRSKAIFKVFSIYTNGMYIFSYDNENQMGFNCLHGMRFLSIVYVVLGHRFLMTLFVPAVNSLDLMEWLLRYRSTIIIGGTVSVDTFFMLSGLLLAYYTMKHLSANHGKMNWLLFYLHRFIRLTPSHAIVVLIHATLIQHLGSGPLWKKTLLAIQTPCQYFWWSALLHVQNYVNPNFICILQTWYLTNDFIYYILSPFLIYPLWKWKYFGWIVLGISYIMGIVINFYLAWINRYGAGMLISNTLAADKFFAFHYIAPHTRASTYFMGIGVGAILHKTRNKKIKMNYLTVTLGWIWSAALILTTILSNHIFQTENHQYSRLEHSLYLAMSRSAWTLGVIWIVWACKHGYGGILNDFLSNPIFQVLSKVSYSIFLWHMPFQFMNNGALKLPIYFSDFSLMHEFLSDICIVTPFALFYTLIFEYPFVRLSRLMKKIA